MAFFKKAAVSQNKLISVALAKPVILTKIAAVLFLFFWQLLKTSVGDFSSVGNPLT